MSCLILIFDSFDSLIHFFDLFTIVAYTIIVSVLSLNLYWEKLAAGFSSEHFGLS